MKNNYGIALLMACIALATGFGMSTESSAKDDRSVDSASESKLGDDSSDDKSDDHQRGLSWRGQRASVVPVSNALYTQECASCHFTYLPGLLPAASWKHLMANLDDHYGDDASLEDARTIAEISAFLERFSADNSTARRSKQIMASLKKNPEPASISDIPYIRYKHREIPAKMIIKNKGVRSLSNCIACHDKADRGVFTEHGIKIPGYGRWED